MKGIYYLWIKTYKLYIFYVDIIVIIKRNTRTLNLKTWKTTIAVDSDIGKEHQTLAKNIRYHKPSFITRSIWTGQTYRMINSNMCCTSRIISVWIKNNAVTAIGFHQNLSANVSRLSTGDFSVLRIAGRRTKSYTNE